MDYVPFVVSLISGGLAGAVVNLVVTRRRQRIEMALKLIDYFFSIYSEVGAVKGLLQSPSSLKTPTELNRVTKVGDWFNLVATLWEKNAADKDILKKAVITKEMERFHELVQNIKNSASELNEAWGWWPEMHRLDFKTINS
jgi:hypothetical protein